MAVIPFRAQVFACRLFSIIPYSLVKSNNFFDNLKKYLYKSVGLKTNNAPVLTAQGHWGIGALESPHTPRRCAHLPSQSGTTGTASAGMGQVYPSAVRLANSARALSSSSGCVIRSTTAAARTLPAWTAAFRPISVRPQETFCQLWPGQPLGQAATWI